MFSRLMFRNHRARLTVLLTATVAATIAVVFVALFLFVKQQTMSRRFSELQDGVETIASEWNGNPSSLDDDVPDLRAAVFDKNGKQLAATSHSVLPARIGKFETDGRLGYGINAGSSVVVGTTSLKHTNAGLIQLAWILGLLWIPMTALAGAAAWYGGGMVLRPIKELVSSAERLSSLDNEQLTTTDQAEFAALASSLNELIGRVRQSAVLQEQFAADAAHELRNPLAILRIRIETNLRRERSVDQHVESQTAMLRQIDHLTSIVETLLATARSEVKPTPPIRVDCALEKAVEEWGALRELDANRVILRTQPCESRIAQDEIAVITANLLDNSLRHSPDSQPIEVILQKQEDRCVLSVRDFGKGLTEEQAREAFQRFYRADEARDRKQGGSGIGLAVVKRIVESRKGSVCFVPVERGALVEIDLPLLIADCSESDVL